MTCPIHRCLWRYSAIRFRKPVKGTRFACLEKWSPYYGRKESTKLPSGWKSCGITLETIQPVSILHAYPHSTFTTTEDPQSLLAVYYAHTEVHSLAHRVRRDGNNTHDARLSSSQMSLSTSLIWTCAALGDDSAIAAASKSLRRNWAFPGRPNCRDVRR